MGLVELDLRDSGKLHSALLRRLDQCARAALGPFDDMLAKLSQNHARNIDWWVSRPASRNVFVSQLFSRCVQLLLIQELLREDQNVTVLTDDIAMATALRTMEYPSLTITLMRSPWRHLRTIARAAMDILSSLFHAAFAAFASRTTLRNRPPLSGKPVTALDVFVLRDSFTNEGAFRDRYYPGLEEALFPHERERFVYVPTFYRIRNYFSLFRAMRQSNIAFLLPQDYLRIGDYRFAFGHWARIRKLRISPAIFAGIDISPLLHADLKRGRFSQSTISALLQYRFWSKDNPLPVRRLIDWYEGQDIDHAIAAALSWNGKSIIHTGFRPACSRMELSVFPARHEISAGVVPPIMAITGKGFRHELAAQRPELKTMTAPGFRYTKLADLSLRPHQIPTILVTLPLAATSVTALVTILRPLIGAHCSEPRRWLIKRHPAMPQPELQRLFPQDVGEFEFVDGDFYNQLQAADLVIGLESSALLEAIAINVPALCLASGNIPTIVPFPDWADPRLWRVCYDAQEASLAIEEMLIAPAAADQLELQENLLSPATNSGIRNFLELD